jgi:hypothetical protein
MTSAPNGSSPRGYSQKKLGIGSKYIVFQSSNYIILVLIRRVGVKRSQW